MSRVGFGRILRIGSVVAIVAGLLSVAQPAFALSSGPDRTWGTDGKTYALAKWGNTIFVAGQFKKAVGTSGQSVPADAVAAFDMTTGAYIPTFTASVTNTQATGKAIVQALAVSTDGSTLYIGGKFDTVDGQPRLNFAAVDTATGTQLSPNVTAAPDSTVQAIITTPSLVYFGGNFTHVSGVALSHLAAISAADGTLSTSWIPSATAGTDPCPSQFPAGTNCGPVTNGGSANIHSMALSLDGTGMYVGGNFFYINGTPRNTIAEVNLTTGALMGWKVPWRTIPSESPGQPYTGPNVVWAILPTPARIFVGYGRTPNGFQAFSSTIGATSDKDCSAATPCATSLWSDGTSGNAESFALSPDGTRLFVGGHFGSGVLDYHPCSGSVYAHGLISVNPANGAYYCDWIPQMLPFGGQNAPGSGVNPPQYVGGWAMQITGSALFVAGYFTSISGVPQSGLARFTLVGSPPPPPPLPTITSFTPDSGVQGSSVTVAGTGFTGATSVTFGTIAATSFTVNSDTQITAVVPDGFTQKKISVTTSGGTAQTATSFRLILSSIKSFTPTSGPEGAQVVLSGAGLTGASDVRFGGVPAAFTVNADSNITATVPMGALTGTISVTTLSGGTISSASSFTVSLPPPPPPVITSFTPVSGLQGSSVVLSGTGFSGASAVSFGTVPATSFTVDSDSQITAVVPGGFTQKAIKVTTAGGTAQSATNFRLILPSISSFTPKNGPEGTQVVLTGVGFTGASDVRFGGVSAAYTVDSGTQITTIVPVGALTGPISVVTAYAGTISSSTSFTVTLPPPPTPVIMSFDPPSGPVGTVVVVNGTGFTGASAVSFGTVPATSFSVDSDGQITAVVPSGFVHSPIKVTTPGGTAKTSTNFVVTS